MYKIKIEDVYECFSSDKEMFDFSNYLTTSKYYGNSNKLAFGKARDATGVVAIEEFVGLKPKMYSFLGDDDSVHEKSKGMNRNAAGTILPNEYKDDLLYNKCIRHSMNKIQSKDHRIRTYEIDKILLSCFDDKIYIQNNRLEGLPFGY